MCVCIRLVSILFILILTDDDFKIRLVFMLACVSVALIFHEIENQLYKLI